MNYLISNFNQCTSIFVSSLTFLSISFTTIHYIVFKNLHTDVLHNTQMEKCPFYNDIALVSYQTYPICASIIYLVSLCSIGYSTIATFAFRTLWYYSRKLPLYLLLIEIILLTPTMYSESFLNYVYVVFSVPIISQIARNPIECFNGCRVLYKLFSYDFSTNTLSNIRDIVSKSLHEYGNFRIPMLDASFIATTKIPKSISKNSNKSTTSPFIKCVKDLVADTIFIRDMDEIWSEIKREIRKCIQKPTFQMIDLSTSQLNQPADTLADKYSNNNGFDILSRIISRVMMIEILGLEMTLADFDIYYDKYMSPNRSIMTDILNEGKRVDSIFILSLFENFCEICKKCTKLRPDGWLAKLLFINHKINISSIEELNILMEKTLIDKNIKLINTFNESSFMFMLAVPTTASLATRCIHVLNYIRDTNYKMYDELIKNANDFYKEYKDKDETLKKPINNNLWVDFVVNVLYWWPPTNISVKLIREINDIYHPGDILIIGLNCDRKAPSFENTFDRYAYMLDNPSTTPQEAFWQDDRVCAAAFFAQNEAAFILAKLYSNYKISIGESKPISYFINRIDYHMRLHDINGNQ